MSVGTIGTGLAPIAADAVGRRSGLMSLLAPLDFPRQAVANAGKSLGGLFSGEGDLGSALMGLAPALLGGAAGLLTGNPLIGSGAAGALQGLGNATGLDAFQAPTPQDVAGSLGVPEESYLGTALVNAMIDPLSFAGIMPALRAGPAQLEQQAARMGLSSLPTEAALSGVEGSYGGLMAKAREAATLQDAQGVMGGAMSNMDAYLGANMPGGEARFGAALNPNQPGSTLQEMLTTASDPRLAAVQYNPAVQASLPDLGQQLTSTMRVPQAAAPDVMEFLNRTGQGLLNPGPGGTTQIAGQIPPGLTRGQGGWVRLGESGLPPAQPPLQMGALPPEMLRPSPMPSLADLAQGMQQGAAVAQPPFPQGLAGVTPGQAGMMRSNLAGIGEPMGSLPPRGVMDMPIDEALRLLQMESRQTGQSLQQMLLQARQMPPEQVELWRRLYPGLEPGRMPEVSSGLLQANPVF